MVSRTMMRTEQTMLRATYATKFVFLLALLTRKCSVSTTSSISRTAIFATSFQIPIIPGSSHLGRRSHESNFDQHLQGNNPKGSFVSLFLASGLPETKNLRQEGFINAQDLESLKTLFARYCDNDGLLAKSVTMEIPVIAELLRDGDLLEEEFNDIWKKASKSAGEGKSERIDVNAFLQVYRSIDDLFEESDEDQSQASVNRADESQPVSILESTEIRSDDDIDEVPLDMELNSIYTTICDENGLTSKEQLKSWDEIQTLLDDGMLGEDEFDELWAKAEKKPGSVDKMDVDGFLTFNVALDNLFEFEDQDGDVDLDADTSSKDIVIGENLSPASLFASLASSNGLVGWDELSRWAELNEMLDGGDLLESELKDLINISRGSMELLDESGFLRLYQEIDDLFEKEDKPSGDIKPQTMRDTSTETSTVTTAILGSSLAKERLLEGIALVSEDSDALPCGLDSTEKEKKVILNLVSALENESSNIIRQKSGVIQTSELAGTWALLYASSASMKFNKGLSGLGGSFPNGRFNGLKQTLLASKYLSDVEYLERIEVRPTSASFDVKVTGAWQLRQSISLFTGQPTVVLQVEPDRVVYGPTSTKADHWKSLGCMNMLDVIYLDDDLRVMRGNTAVDTIFIWRRTT